LAGSRRHNRPEPQPTQPPVVSVISVRRSLIVAIETYLQANNDDPKPFVWTASADAILENIRRGRVALNNIAS